MKPALSFGGTATTTTTLADATAGPLALLDIANWTNGQPTLANVQSSAGAKPDRPPCLGRCQFYDRFERIEKIDCFDCHRYRRLLWRAMTTMERTDISLGFSVTSLRLKICCDRLEQCSIGGERLSSNIAVVCRMIAACRSLLNLDLKICDFPDCDRYRAANWDKCNSSLDQVATALKTNSAYRMPLKELTLRNFWSIDFGQSFSTFKGLETLAFRRCNLSTEIWCGLLERCRRTLLGLTLERCVIGWCQFDQPFDRVELPKLRRLDVDDGGWYGDDRFFLTAETLGRARLGRVSVWVNAEPETLDTIYCCLSPEMGVACSLTSTSNMNDLSLVQNLFGAQLIELRVHNSLRLPAPDQLNAIIDQLESIRVLVMNGSGPSGDQFLLRFLADNNRCAKLQRVMICWNLQMPTVRYLLRRCPLLDSRFVCPQIFNGQRMSGVDVADATDRAASTVNLGCCLQFTVDWANRLLRNYSEEVKAEFLQQRLGFVSKNNPANHDATKRLFSVFTA